MGHWTNPNYLKGETVTPRKINYPTTRKRRKFADHTGKVFGRLTISSYRGDNKSHMSTWLCKCECGGEIVVPYGRLSGGNTRSCGCLKKEVPQRQPGHRSFSDKGVGIASRNVVLYGYRRSAERRGYSWNLTEEHAIELFQGNCHYCGCEPAQHARSRWNSGGYRYNGIDRIDPSKGYEPGNVVSCCSTCNMGKREMSREAFCAWIGRVNDHLIKTKKATGGGQTRYF